MNPQISLELLCRNSQELRAFARKGKILGQNIQEDQIQPASFEPRLSDELFAISTKGNELFRPSGRSSIYRQLLEEVPHHRRTKINCSEGYELKKGFTYVLRLQEKLKIDPGELVKSSPKSSLGRLFVNSRLMADYNGSFDEITHQIPDDIELWLLVQPLAFNMIVYPDISLNQLRFFSHDMDCSLSDRELKEEYEKNPILFDKESGLPLNPVIKKGLQVHLDLEGKSTAGVVGFRAIDNPEPIDLKKKAFYKNEDFFEPILKGRVVIDPQEHYLFPTLEKLVFPSHLNAELQATSHIGTSGPWHFAGFIDNDFAGDLVLELQSQEQTSVRLEHGMPVSRMEVFRTKKPDKLYGMDINSNYSGQIGARTAKYFMPIDYDVIAKNYDKLNRDVLVVESRRLLAYRNQEQGFEEIARTDSEPMFEEINNGFFASRYQCEDDRLVLQPIAYILLFGPDKTVYTYVRSGSIKDFGEKKLFGKHSIGVGGHVARSDAPEYIPSSAERELTEEVVVGKRESDLILQGTLMCYNLPVDTVHFGLVYAMMTDGDIRHRESSIQRGKMINIQELLEFPLHSQAYETWSNELFPYLTDIYNSLKQQ